MTKDEAKLLVEEMAALWPNWKAETGEIAAWLTMLCRFDLAAARKALGEYWEDCKTSKPVAAAFKAKYMAGNPPVAQPVDDGNPNGYAGVSVQCVQAPASNLWLLGHYEPICFGSPRLIPPWDRVMACANRLRDRLIRQHGGQWEIVESRTVHEMILRKRDLRAQQWS